MHDDDNLLNFPSNSPNLHALRSVLDIFKIVKNRRKAPLQVAAQSKYLEVWKRAREKIREKLQRRAYRELDLYETGMELDFDRRVRRLKGLTMQHRITLDEITLLPFYIIHPKSSMKRYWTGLMIFVLLYTATIMPYRITFTDSVVYDGWWYMDNALNILFFTDFLFSCLTAFYDKNNKLVYNWESIMVNYLKGWMLIDFFGFFPFDEVLISQGSTKHYNNLIRLLRLPRLYRLLKVSRIMKFFKTSTANSKAGTFFESFRMKESTLKLLTFFATVFICSHLMTCLFYFAAKFNDFSPATWIARYNYIDYSLGEQYIASMYWSYTTLCTVGYGDITPGTNMEIILAILWMAFSVGFFSFTIGSLTSMLTGVDTK